MKDLLLLLYDFIISFPFIDYVPFVLFIGSVVICKFIVKELTKL